MPTGNKWRPTSTDNISLNDTAAVGNGTPIAVQDCRQAAWVMEYDSADAPTTGTVYITSSYDKDYTGEWDLLGTVDIASVVAGTGGATGTYPGPLGFLRGEIRTGTEPDKAITLKIHGLLG